MGYDLVLQYLTPPAAPASRLGVGSPLLGGTLAPAAAAAPALRDTSLEGVTYADARAGVMRSLAQLGAAHLLQALAPAPGGATGAAASQAIQSLGQWDPAPLMGAGAGSGSGAAPGQGGGGAPVHAALAAAVAGLAAGDVSRCKGAIMAAQRSLVSDLVTASREGAATINLELVQLQMLQAVSEAWELKWPALPTLGAVGSPSKRGARAGQASPAAAAAAGPSLLPEVLRLWRGREAAAGSGARYELLAPLGALRQELLRTLGAPDLEADAVEQAARAARKLGRHAQATASLFKLRGLLRGACAGGEEAAPEWARRLAAPSASWRVEDAKLLWAQGQRDTAVHVARGLLQATAPPDEDGSPGSSPGGSPGGSPGPAAIPAPDEARGYLQCLAAKWLAETRSESTAAVLRMMSEAVEEFTDDWGHSTGSALACRVMYRLAHYADGLYRNIEAQRSSPEGATTQALIASRRAQLAESKAQMEERKRSGLCKVGKTGRYTDRNTLALWVYISGLEKTLRHDESEAAMLEDRAARFRIVALFNYCRCLEAGSGYDLPSVFRLVQLWLAEGADDGVNRIVHNSICDAASHKFLPLAYQIASRLSAGERAGRRWGRGEGAGGTLLQAVV